MYVLRPVSHVSPHAMKVKTQVTRTMIRLTRVESAGTASASCSRRFSPRARGMARAAEPRVRASVAARFSGRYPHSSPRRRAHHHGSLCLVHIHHSLGRPRPCSRPTPSLGPYHMARFPRQVRLSSCRAIHVSAADCAGDVADAGRPRSCFLTR
jgi:hypothetical protein